VRKKTRILLCRRYANRSRGKESFIIYSTAGKWGEGSSPGIREKEDLLTEPGRRGFSEYIQHDWKGQKGGPSTARRKGASRKRQRGLHQIRTSGKSAGCPSWRREFSEGGKGNLMHHDPLEPATLGIKPRCHKHCGNLTPSF